METLLQLYSINSELNKNVEESIETIRKIGYSGVEFAGYFNMSENAIKEILDKNNLYSVGAHISVDRFKFFLEDELIFNKFIGSKYIICPYAQFDSIEDIEELATILNKASEKSKKYGIKVGYHNHAHEFEKIDGKYILDLLIEKTVEDVIFELDVFWANYAGVDPIEYIKKWKQRIELIHMKQIDSNKKNVDMPDGIIDMAVIKTTAKFAKYFILEHEEYDKDVWESLKNDFRYLTSL